LFDHQLLLLQRLSMLEVKLQNRLCFLAEASVFLDPSTVGFLLVLPNSCFSQSPVFPTELPLPEDSTQEERFESILDEIQTTASFSAFLEPSNSELFRELGHLEFLPFSVSCSLLRNRNQKGLLPNQKRLWVEQKLLSDGQLELLQFPSLFRQIRLRAFSAQI